jgi:sugar lactone lactonase YvrE
MSKLTSLLATAVVAGAVTACGDSPGDPNEPAKATPASESTPPPHASTSARETPARDLKNLDLQGIAVARDGSVFAADAGASRVLRVGRRGRITNFAGQPGLHGLEGDGGPASEALLRGPTGLAVDSPGNLYITDHGNHRVRKVDPTGTITKVVGSGPEGSASGGFSGDGGPATKARLQEPVAVAADGSGHIYIADRDNYRVRAVDTEGMITTHAGNGETGPKRIDGPATDAALGLPVGVAAGPRGSVYLSDEPAHRIYRVTLRAS